MAFFDFPAEHWIHLKTTNPIESTFATVRLRTKVTKGPGSKTAGLAMAYKLYGRAWGPTLTAFALSFIAHLGYFAVFYCTGQAADGGTAVKETCTMRYRGGKVMGSFKITDNPYYSGS